MSVHKNIVNTSRLKPQLVRKRTIVKVPQTIKVVAKQPVVATIKQKAKVGEGRVQRGNQAHKTAARSSIVHDRVRRQHKKSPKVRYLTKDPTPQSKERIAKLRNIGQGRYLVIIGNGPSIGQIPLEKLKSVNKVDLLTINKPDQRVWPTRFWAFFDRSQINRHRGMWDNFNGTVFNSTAIKEQKPTSMQFKNLGGKGFSQELTKGLHIGRSSVYAALQIALWMEYDKIYIFGCDMNPDGIDGKLHFYGTNPDVDPTVRAQRFEREASHYDVAADGLGHGERQRFVFCSKGINPWPFVERFSSIEHTAAVDHIINCSKSL